MIPKSVAEGLSAPTFYSLGDLAPFVPSKPNHVGVHRPLPDNIMSFGKWSTLPSGERVWRIGIKSPDAKMLRLHFTNFDVGAAKVLVFVPGDTDGSSTLGPYADKGPIGDGEFWSGGIFADSAIVEYQPEQETETLSFHIDMVSHIVVGFAPVPNSGIGQLHVVRDPNEPLGGSSKLPDLLRDAVGTKDAALSCNLDVSCYSAWNTTSYAIALLSIEKPTGPTWCTGWLINTRTNSYIPYLITNNHCISSQAEANTLTTFWQYRTSYCNGFPPATPPYQYPIGATLLATSPVNALDFSLVRLPAVPSNATFLGWSLTTLQLSDSIVALHHPAEDYQRITFSTVSTPYLLPSYGINATDYFEFHSTAGNGLMEHGSSGAPWMKAPGIVVGMEQGGSPAFPTCFDLSGGLVEGWGPRFTRIYDSISSYLEDCSFSVNSSATTFTAFGGSGTITVNPSGNCAWTATSNAFWVTINSGATGFGAGNVGFSVQANSSFYSRTGTISVAGQTITIMQSGNVSQECNYSLSQSSITVQTGGTTGSFTVYSSTPSSCSYNASSNAGWLTFTYGSNGTVNYTVAANTNAASRTGTITISAATASGSVVFTVTQLGVGGQSSGLRFVSLTPCRVMETRSQYNFEGRTGSFGPPYLNAGETRTLYPSLSNVCSIPSTAKAYVFNVTLVPRGTGVDFVTVWPAGDPRPSVLTNFWTIRSPDAKIVANSAIVKAGNYGGISVYTWATTDMLIDISGYFTDDPKVSNLVYYPLTPCRVIDTRIDYRSPPGPFGPPSMSARETRRFKFPATPYCSIPTGAAAYSFTITAVPPSPLQYLTAWPSGGNQPNVSSINSPSGRILANSVILPASADGSIDVYAYDTTDFLVDINGYFAPDNGSGLYYYPVIQCRAYDTTALSGLPFADNETRTIAVPVAAGCSGIPANAKGYAVNVTAIPNGSPMPFITAYPTGQNRPNASILNAFQGQTVTNSAIIPAGTNGAIDVYAYKRTNVVVEISGYFGR
ncbi:MAG: trypsin-like peptidase domain-containing protein [Bryobacterales bacterium]|nr:trypsin-like peptidase domain-containing protein [Bryobacterales bacterium]